MYNRRSLRSARVFREDIIGGAMIERERRCSARTWKDAAYFNGLYFGW